MRLPIDNLSLIRRSAFQTVDRFNNLLVTAFVTPGNARFLLLHDGRNDESIKTFFTEVYEIYVRVSCYTEAPALEFMLRLWAQHMPVGRQPVRGIQN